MDTEIIEQPKTDLAVIEKKRDAWGKLGVAIDNSELKLQVRAQAATTALSVLPQTIDDVAEAEKILKEVKAAQALIVEERKKITSKLDDVKLRLMVSETSITPALNNYSDAIIKIKQEKESKDRERKAKEDEVQQIRHQLISAVAKYNAEFKTLIAEKVNRAFTHALEKNIHPGDECNDYMDRVNFRVKESMFLPTPPFIEQPKYLSQDEVLSLYDELFVINPKDYVDLFVTEMENRFCDYEVAYNNKKTALEIAKKEQEERLQQIKQEEDMRIISSELDSVATDMSVEPSGIKALKKCYVVDLPETYENAMNILRAFNANKAKCMEKITNPSSRKWFSFNADSAAKVLSRVKSDDNAFAPAGIVWKEVDKL